MGSSGPWCNWMGYGRLVRCAAGLTSLWRYPDDPEFFGDATTIYPDNYCARVMAAAGLAGLIQASRTGTGMHIEGAQAEIILPELSTVLASESLAPGTGFEVAANAGYGSPWGIFPCAGDDEWCVITVRDDGDWLRLVQVVDGPTGKPDPAHAGLAGRVADTARITKWLSSWTARHSPRVVQDTLQAAGVPAGMMQRVSEFFENQHLADRDYLAVLEQPGLGAITVENAPFAALHIPAPDIRPGAAAG